MAEGRQVGLLRIPRQSQSGHLFFFFFFFCAEGPQSLGLPGLAERAGRLTRSLSELQLLQVPSKLLRASSSCPVGRRRERGCQVVEPERPRHLRRGRSLHDVAELEQCDAACAQPCAAVGSAVPPDGGCGDGRQEDTIPWLWLRRARTGSLPRAFVSSICSGRGWEMRMRHNTLAACILRIAVGSQVNYFVPLLCLLGQCKPLLRLPFWASRRGTSSNLREGKMPEQMARKPRSGLRFARGVKLRFGGFSLPCTLPFPHRIPVSSTKTSMVNASIS